MQATRRSMQWRTHRQNRVPTPPMAPFATDRRVQERAVMQARSASTKPVSRSARRRLTANRGRVAVFLSMVARALACRRTREHAFVRRARIAPLGAVRRRLRAPASPGNRTSVSPTTDRRTTAALAADARMGIAAPSMGTPATRSAVSVVRIVFRAVAHRALHCPIRTRARTVTAPVFLDCPRRIQTEAPNLSVS